jgi:hypothetical protein
MYACVVDGSVVVEVVVSALHAVVRVAWYQVVVEAVAVNVLAGQVVSTVDHTVLVVGGWMMVEV